MDIIFVKIKKMVTIVIAYVFLQIVCSAVSNSLVLYITLSVIRILVIVFLMNYMNKNNTISIIGYKVNSLLIAILVAVLAVLYKFTFSAWSNFLVPGSLTSTNYELNIMFVLNVLFFAPISEELLYRYSISNIFILDKNKIRFKVMVSIIGTLIWNFRHGDKVINISLIIASLIIYIIYFKTNNVIYCIIFHSFSNLMNIMLFKISSISDFLLLICKNKYSFAVSTVLFCIFFVLINNIINVFKKKYDKKFQVQNR